MKANRWSAANAHVSSSLPTVLLIVLHVQKLKTSDLPAWNVGRAIHTRRAQKKWLRQLFVQVERRKLFFQSSISISITESISKGGCNENIPHYFLYYLNFLERLFLLGIPLDTCGSIILFRFANHRRNKSMVRRSELYSEKEKQ